ncbi:MAG: glycosyltransferase family 4 protein [bacterium]
MIIFFIAPRYHTNQVHVVKAMQEDGHDVYFHVTQKGPTEDYTSVVPIVFKQSKVSKAICKLFGEGGHTTPRLCPSIIRYYKEIKNLSPDIVIIRNPYRWFSKLAAFYSLMLNVKIVFYTQEPLHRKIKKRTKLKKMFYIEMFNAAWMTPIIGDSKRQNKSVQGMFYVPLPVHVEQPHKLTRPRDPRETKILCIGKYHQNRKKLKLFIDSLYLLKDDHNFEATIIGECVTDEQKKKYDLLNKYIEDKNLKSQIRLLKNIPYAEMVKQYKSHDLFVLPAINEPYAISVCEALGFGLPVICTDTCGARFHITNGVNGYIIKSNSLSDLTITISSILTNNKLLLSLSENAMEYAQNNLSRSVFREHFYNMLWEKFKTFPCTCYYK